VIPLTGFAPDADPTTPGVMTDCENLIPYLMGMEAAPSAVTPSEAPALAAECIGAAVVTDLTNARRVIAGTTVGLYELSGGVWNDRSKVGGYTGGADTRWSITQFGNATLAANKSDTIQRSVGVGSSFADIAGAPKAEIIFPVGSFVMALNVDDGTDKVDGWHCCAAFDDTDWTPSTLTLSASGRLVGVAGVITAGARLGEYAIAYKENGMFLGQYVGAPAVWDWIQVPGGEVGCVGKDALCDIGGAHFFVGPDNFWLFDGTRPVPIADNMVRQWFADNSSAQYRYRTKAVYDSHNNRVWVFYPGEGSETCNQAIVYHVLAKKWGRATLNVQSVMNYVTPGLTYDEFDTLGGTYDTLQEIPYDSQYWLVGGSQLSVFDGTNQPVMLSGDGMNSGFTTGDFGDDDSVMLLKQLRLRYASGRGPTTATATVSHKMNSGDSWQIGASGAMNDGKFDMLKAARWHQARFEFTGSVRVTQMQAKADKVGAR
jgi:hypothetical protein